MAISPGAYIALRRQAHGLLIEDVAAKMYTVPHHLNEAARVHWLRQIEADASPMSNATIDALREVFRFDPVVLLRLDEIHRGARLPEPRICLGCGCSELDACDTSGGRCQFIGCHWVSDTLCSACATRAGIAPDRLGAAA